VIFCDGVRSPTGASGSQPLSLLTKTRIAVILHSFTMFKFGGRICYAQRRQSQPFGMNLGTPFCCLLIRTVLCRQAALIAGGLRG
jgi:hypothetical protein